jgi:hypothetical protein
MPLIEIETPIKIKIKPKGKDSSEPLVFRIFFTNKISIAFF